MKKNEIIAPIILAAGSSEQLGLPKALADFGGTTALRIAVKNCAGYERPIVVLGCDAERVLPKVPRQAKVAINTHWREGQLGSLLCAVEQVAADAALLVYPVDHPLLLNRDVSRLVAEYRRRGPGEEIVMPRHAGKYGHPILLSLALRSELAHASTTREVVYRIPERLRVFEAKTSAIYEDFHTSESYKKCLHKFLARKRARSR